MSDATEMEMRALEIACRLATDVAELRGCTSPAEYPNHMLVTPGELIDMATASLLEYGREQRNAALEAAALACRKERISGGSPSWNDAMEACAEAVEALKEPAA